MKKFLLLISCIFTLQSYPQEYVMAVDSWQPFRSTTPSSSLTGIDIDILDLISNNLNLNIVALKKPWNQCLQDMKSGKGDLMMGLAYSEEKAKYISYLKEPYYSISPAFFTKQTNIEVEKYDDLKQYRIGYVDGLSYFPQFDNDKELIKIPVTQETQLIEMLYKGYIDIMIGTDIQIKYELQEQGLSDTIVEIKYRPDYNIDLYIGISKKSDFIEYKQEIENILHKIKFNGELSNIINSYIIN